MQVAALEFSRDRKMMSVLCRQGVGCTLFCKGAPEALLQRCSQVQNMKTAAAAAAEQQQQHPQAQACLSLPLQLVLHCSAEASPEGGVCARAALCAAPVLLH